MRIEQVGPTRDNVSLNLGATDQSVSGKALSVALSADGARAYLGGHSGVWRSDDGGVTWWQPTRPQPPSGQTAAPGSLVVPNVYDLAISPANHDIVFAATGHDARSPEQSGVYRSLDGGATWTLVHQVATGTGPLRKVFQISQLAIAPDDPDLVFAAGGAAIAISRDGGATWTETRPQLSTDSDVFWHVAVGPRFGASRFVFAVGSGVWCSRDGGETWVKDTAGVSLGAAASAVGVGAHALAVHPGDGRIIFVTMSDGSVWMGTHVELPLPGVWTRLASTPIIPNGPTDSGANFIVPHVTPDGQVFLIASDRRTVHIAYNLPFVTGAWTRFEDGSCHVDPHALAVTPDFHPAIASGNPPSRGRAVLVNDGGVNVTTDGAKTWSHGSGLATLNVINVAVNPVGAKGPPLLCFGCGDNFGFSSPDGGAHWQTQDYLGGDNDCAFSDPRQPSRVFVFAPRSEGPNAVFGQIYDYIAGNDGPPNVAWGTGDRHAIPGPVNLPLANPSQRKRAGWNAVSPYVIFGFRPVVLTAPGEAPLPDGDVIIVRFTADAALLMRTSKLSQISSADDWASTATADGPEVKAFQVGPPLPVKTTGVVQASGGHRSTVYYVGEPYIYDDYNAPGRMRLWKWTTGMAAWQQIVPSGAATAPTVARRFFVDPYWPQRVYVLANDHVYRSDDGGQSWAIESGLERLLTADGAFPIQVGFDENPADALLRDMQFDPYRPGTRFAAGPAGVFATYDGQHWDHLLMSEPLALRPMSLMYDYRSCPRALYVTTFNSGLLRLSPIPPDWDYPMGSVQAAEGVITLLRVHDPGTGYGPPDDQLDADVIVWLDTEPEKAFGFTLRNDTQQRTMRGKLKALRDAFNDNRRVRLEFIRTGCRTGRIVRVIARQ